MELFPPVGDPDLPELPYIVLQAEDIEAEIEALAALLRKPVDLPEGEHP